MNTVFASMLLSGNAITNSTIGKGFMRLLDDAKGFLLIAGIALCTVMLIFLFAKKSMASEQEQVEIKRNIKAVMYAAVGIVTATAIITLVTSYFI